MIVKPASGGVASVSRLASKFLVLPILSTRPLGSRIREPLGVTLLLVLPALCVTGASGVAHAYCRLTTQMPMPGDNCSSGGIGLSWHRQCISYSVMPPMHSDPPLDAVRNTVDACFATWAAVTCNGQRVGLDLRQTDELAECAQPQYNTHEPNANTILFLDDWAARSLPADAFGLTLVWHNPDTGEIYDADMQINETLGTITICGQTCPAGAVDLQNVVTHEAGHFLGLGHSMVKDATMSARATIGETSKRVLADDDKQGLCSIYGNNPPTHCADSDFVPNHGFSAKCGSGSTESTSSTGCTVVALGRDSPAVPAGRALFGLLPALLVLRQRRRLRPRAATSSASPSPMNT
ncbi:MAG: matrixin family metalloprotease [Polyangiales bacterium]